MTRDEFLHKRHEISFIAGMNQRYQQSNAAVYAIRDRSFRIAVGLLTVMSAMLSIITAQVPGLGWIAASIAVSSTAAAIGVILNVLPFADSERKFRDLYRRWCDLREEIDSLEFELSGTPTKAIVDRLRQLDGKVHRISALDTETDKRLLQKCFDDEQRSREEIAVPPVESPDEAIVAGAAN